MPSVLQPKVKDFGIDTENMFEFWDVSVCQLFLAGGFDLWSRCLDSWRVTGVREVIIARDLLSYRGHAKGRRPTLSHIVDI